MEIIIISLLSFWLILSLLIFLYLRKKLKEIEKEMDELFRETDRLIKKANKLDLK